MCIEICEAAFVNLKYVLYNIFQAGLYLASLLRESKMHLSSATQHTAY
jgi:hypothetical protein